MKESLESAIKILRNILILGWAYCLFDYFTGGHELSPLELQACQLLGSVTGFYIWFYFVPNLMLKTWRKFTAFVAAKLKPDLA